MYFSMARSTGTRYCINGVALTFAPSERVKG
jgi:peptide methionine sulfoxide reductase MsrB